jgi:hypothetical protein
MPALRPVTSVTVSDGKPVHGIRHDDITDQQVEGGLWWADIGYLCWGFRPLAVRFIRDVTE